MPKEINWDDDEQVEKFKAKQERAADTATRAAEKKRTVNMDDDVLMAEVLKKVVQVVDNMENGDGVLINSLIKAGTSSSGAGMKAATAKASAKPATSAKPAKSAKPKAGGKGKKTWHFSK